MFAAHGAEEAAEEVGAADADDSPVLPSCCRAVGWRRRLRTHPVLSIALLPGEHRHLQRTNPRVVRWAAVVVWVHSLIPASAFVICAPALWCAFLPFMSLGRTYVVDAG